MVACVAEIPRLFLHKDTCYPLWWIKTVILALRQVKRDDSVGFIGKPWVETKEQMDKQTNGTYFSALLLIPLTF